MLLAWGSLALGCDDKKTPAAPPAEPPIPPRPAPMDASVVLDAEVGEAGAAAAARRFVAELRRTKLDVAARRVPSQRMAFAKDRLVQLTDAALVVYDTKNMKEAARLPMTEPRRVVASSGGELIVATRNEVFRVPRDVSKAERFSRLPLFVDSLLFADKRQESKLWVLHGIDPTLYPYEIAEGGKLETLDFLALEDFDNRGFAALKDGSFAYTAGKQLVRFFPGGKRVELALPDGADVWRLLTTRRIDQLWLARSDGKVQLVQLAAAKLSLVKTLELPGAFDIDSNDSELAILRLERATEGKDEDAGGSTRSWTVAVFDASGKEQLSVALPLDSPSGSDDDWVRDITKNRAVVLSGHGPFVAVGGPTWLAVWNAKSGQRVLAP